VEILAQDPSPSIGVIGMNREFQITYSAVRSGCERARDSSPLVIIPVRSTFMMYGYKSETVCPEHRFVWWLRLKLKSLSQKITRLSPQLTIEKYQIVELYTGNLGEREMLENYILSKGTGEAQYLCGRTRAHIRSAKEIQADNMENQGTRMRTELHTSM